MHQHHKVRQMFKGEHDTKLKMTGKFLSVNRALLGLGFGRNSTPERGRRWERLFSRG
jgi:hypothetical protein